MLSQNDVFEKISPLKAIARNAIPSVISMFVIILYNVADTFFIGQTGDPMQVAAVSLATPVFLLFMAVGSLIGTGGTSVISRALGSKRDAYAKHVSAFCFIASLVTGLFFTVALWAFMPIILDLIGTSRETAGYAQRYLMYIAPCAPFAIFATAFSTIIRAEGQSTKAAAGMMLGTIINIILDPLMITTLRMGVDGAAVATLIGNVAGASYYLLYLRGRKTVLSISFRDVRVREGIFTGVFAIGFPAALGNILMSVSSVILNNFLVGYGDIQVAAMGIAVKVVLIVVLLQLGFATGIQPLLGYNYGAQNRSRFRSIMRLSLVCSFIMGALSTLVCWFGADTIVRAFIENDDVITHGVTFVKAILVSGPVIGLLFIFMNALQAVGAVGGSLILSLSRQGCVFIPLLFILVTLFGLTGIVYAQPAADLLSIFLSAFFYFFRIRKWKDAKDIVPVSLRPA